MLLREYAIERSFVISPLLTNVSALPKEMLKCKKNASFLSHTVLVNCRTSAGHWLSLFSLVTHNSCCCCYVAPQISSSSELSSGPFWGQCPERKEVGCFVTVVLCWMHKHQCTVLLKDKIPSVTCFVASNICWDSKIFQQYCQLVFTPDLVKNNSVVWVWCAWMTDSWCDTRGEIRCIQWHFRVKHLQLVI